MPQNYKRKTGREWDQELEDATRAALRDVLDDKKSLRAAVKDHPGVTKSRLANLLKKVKEGYIEAISLVPNFRQRQVFSPHLEQELCNYLINCSKMFYGLNPKMTRRLAYQYAKSNKLTVPETWNQDKMAGEKWFNGFLKRNPTLSIRTPEATSLARMTSFNRTTVQTFFSKLEQVMERHQFQPHQIFNLDETGVLTVPKMDKVVGKKGQKQVGQVSSRERGELVTLVGIICANGNALPPVFVFPRVRYDETKMMAGAPPGAEGLVYKSGWMTSENFVKVLQFFKKQTRCSKDSPVLLILDNHESHLCVDGLTFCKENGIVVLTLPPHTSNKLQPLDRTVYGPFKKYFASASNAWMLSHPNEVLTIYSIPALSSTAWDLAATPSNVKSGFRATGISPLNKDVFTDDDYASSIVSDRPCPDASNAAPSASTSFHTTRETTPPRTSSSVSFSGVPDPSSIVTTVTSLVSPEEVRPYPKAKPRKLGNRGRKPGRCMIATDTPEKEELENRGKKRKAVPKQVIKPKVILRSSSSSSVSSLGTLSDDSGPDPFEEISEDEVSVSSLAKGDFAIFKVATQSASTRNYVGQIVDTESTGFVVKFFSRQVASNRFKATNEKPAFVPFEDVLTKLPKPIEDNRKRFEGLLYFNVDLAGYSLYL